MHPLCPPEQQQSCNPVPVSPVPVCVPCPCECPHPCLCPHPLPIPPDPPGTPSRAGAAPSLSHTAGFSRAQLAGRDPAEGRWNRGCGSPGLGLDAGDASG